MLSTHTRPLSGADPLQPAGERLKCGPGPVRIGAGVLVSLREASTSVAWGSWAEVVLAPRLPSVGLGVR